MDFKLISCTKLLSTKELIKYLEDKVTDAGNPDRLRLLKGEDPTCSELREKLEKLQVCNEIIRMENNIDFLIQFHSISV